MKCCPEYEERLLLDIHGELDSRTHAECAAHRETCAGCREEHMRLLRLFGKMKQVMTPPAFTHGESERLIRAVRQVVGSVKKEMPSPGWEWLRRPWRLTPALATICALVALIVFLSPGTFDTVTQKFRTSGQDSLEGINGEDLEVITNLDLLRQLDTVQKLVQTLDEPENSPPPPPENNPDTQGSLHDKKKPHYA